MKKFVNTLMELKKPSENTFKKYALIVMSIVSKSLAE